MREGLEGADHDLLAARQRLGQLAALAAVIGRDGGDHALGAFKVKDGFLQLVIEHVAVGDHQHGIEQLVVVLVVQVGEEMRGPGDGVGLARPGGILDEVFP